MNSLWSDGYHFVYEALEALPRPLDPAFVNKLEELAKKISGEESYQLNRITRILSWLPESERAKDVLFSLVSDESIHERDRQQAVFDLSSTGDSRAYEPLVNILDNAESYIRKKAAKALEKLNTNENTP